MSIFATYTNPDKANEVLQKLLDAGVSGDKISVIANESASSHLSEEVKDGMNSANTANSSIIGGIGGAATMFLLGAAAIAGWPGLLVGGPVAAILTGLGANTAIGAAVGALTGLVAGLVKAGASEEDAKYGEEVVKSGGVVLIVEEDAAGMVRQIIQESSPSKLSHITN